MQEELKFMHNNEIWDIVDILNPVVCDGNTRLKGILNVILNDSNLNLLLKGSLSIMEFI